MAGYLCSVKGVGRYSWQNVGIFFSNFISADVLASVGMLLSGGLRVRYPISLLPWCVHGARPRFV